MSKTTKEWVQLYLDEVGAKYDKNIKVRPKSEAKLLKVVRPFVELFNKRFWDGYITTIGKTIWVPDGWLENGDLKSRLQTIAHECIHVKQSKKYTTVFFSFLYLFPQSLALFSLLSFLAIGFGLNWLWCLLFLLCLAPLPAPFRYMFELEAYRVKLLFFKHAWTATPSMKQWAKEGIIRNLAKSDYYFTWPFPKMIQRDLDKEDKLNNEQYKEILTFLEDNDLAVGTDS